MTIGTKMTYYAVARGHNPGIYTDWNIVKENVHGFSGAVYEGFKTNEEAEKYLAKYKKENSTTKNVVATTNNKSLETLTDEQMTVIHHLLHGRNIFLTGGGGVGKSHVLSVIYTEFPGLKKSRLANSLHGPAKLPRIQMCALTGCAALLLGHKAKTIHSWAGIGLGKGTVQELCIKIRRNNKAMRNWLCTDLLIIDEISMMTAELLDKLNEIGKKIRSNRQPFGGIQVIFVGDFYQLPPVNKSDEPTRFAFESAGWNECNLLTIELTQIQRQKDARFQRVLKEARVGALSKESCAILRECEGRNWKEHKIRPTLLFPRRAEVEMINDSNLRALTGRRYTYKARLVYDGKIPDSFTESDENFVRVLQMYDSNAPYAKELELIMDAQVMLVANVDPDSGLVNGSRGVVVGFCPSSELPIVEFVNGMKKPVGTHTWPIEDYEFVSRSQVPLRLAYANTIHVSQGSSLDAALVDIGTGNFEFGQAYVALSRVRSLEALYVYDFDPTAFKAHPKVKAFYEEMATCGGQTANTVSDIREEILEIRDGLITDANKEDIKPIVAEASRAIKAVCVNKMEANNGDNEVEGVEGVEADNKVEPPSNWLFDSAPESWKSAALLSCKEKLLEISNTLTGKDFLPAKENIWRALDITPLSAIKVVILGQDPYPTPGNACGLAFSVSPDTRPIPASLKNIYKELESDLPDFKKPEHGDLEAWAKQGVLLLNTVLTVEAGAPQSHTKIGWEEVTDQIIRSIAAQTTGTIFVLWGKSAQVKKKLLGLYLDKNKHRVFESAHPSPLSASRGFLGSKPFSKVNEWLVELGKEAINWHI